MQNEKVADAVANSWVYRLLPNKVWPFAQLARWERPIGWWLLLWPCWWSFALALGVVFQDPIISGAWSLFLVPITVGFAAFWIGAIAMRGAGCTYNDIVDVDIDAKVSRTASRPIPSGRVTKSQAKGFFVTQAIVGLVVLLVVSSLRGEFSAFTFVLGVASLLTLAIYPFAKRFTNWPQLFLGFAFSWGALMGWAALLGSLNWAPIVLYLGSIFWVIGYDTIYAHQDLEDDAVVGVKSTARLFGDKTKQALIVLYGLALCFFGVAFWLAGASIPTFVALAAASAHMIWQLRKLDIEDGDNCLSLFKSNSHLGWILFVGLLVDVVF